MVIQHGVLGICIALHRVVWVFGFRICMSIAWVFLFWQYGYGLCFAVVSFAFCFLFYHRIEAVNQISVKNYPCFPSVVNVSTLCISLVK
jgi:hypothetical protein